MSRVIVITCIACLIASIGIGAVYYYVQAQQAQNQIVLTPITAGYRHITSEINISGTTKASETVDLAFKNGGIVDTVLVATGESVPIGTTLMALRSNTLKDQLSQARANLNTQVSILNDLKNGTRPEQIAITQAELESDETALKNALSGLFNALSNAQSVANVTVRFTIDKFISNPSMSNSQLTIQSNDTNLSLALLDQRRQIDLSLSTWSTRISLIQRASADELLSESTEMHAYLVIVSTILDGLTRILTMDSSTQLDANSALVSTARATVISTNDALTSAEQKVFSAQAARSITQRQLALEKAGPTNDAIAAQQAIVDGTLAQVAERQDEMNDQSITAPFGGIITNVDAKQGEIVSAGTAVVSMISNGRLKVEGYVPEVHYSEIAIGESVRIVLDAFPGVSFQGTLALIDPTAMLRDGVPNFKVTVYFTNPDPRVRPGLTASAFIQTANKSNVITIPLAAVTGNGDSATVMRLVGSTVERTSVVLGVTSTDGYVEVVSGLKEKDVVLVNETKQYRIVPN